MDDSANNTLPDMPTPARGSFGCCTIDSKIYVLGGHVGPSHTWQVDNYTAQVDCYDIGNNQWLPTRTPRPLAAEGFRVAVYEQYIYAFGGFEYLAPETGKPNVYTGVSSDQIDRYDTINDTWETVGKLPRPRSDYMIGIIGTTVYLFGGWSANGITNKSPVLTEVDTFDSATGAIGTAPVTFDPPFIGPPPEDTSSLIAETCARHTAPESDSQAPTISVSESTTSGKIDGGPDFEREPVLGGEDSYCLQFALGPEFQTRPIQVPDFQHSQCKVVLMYRNRQYPAISRLAPADQNHSDDHNTGPV